MGGGEQSQVRFVFDLSSINEMSLDLTDPKADSTAYPGGVIR